MNILFCSVGRRAELLKNFRKTMGGEGKIIATDISKTAPALYFSDSFYIVPPISSDNYIDEIFDICIKEKIDAITTCIDPEIMLLAKHREKFDKIGVTVLAPYKETAEICFDKFRMFEHLKKNRIATVNTYGDFESFLADYENKNISFPVFVKPRTGSGSVGARKISSIEELKTAFENDHGLIAQEYMGEALDVDADVYIDTVSHEPVAIFTKKKLETRIGGASKTISFIDEKLVDFLRKALKFFEFNGPIDVDLFYKDGEYYLSEINPRFGGAYLHAYGAGVDFVKLIQNNIDGKQNAQNFFSYNEDIAMLMYDSVVICNLKDTDNE